MEPPLIKIEASSFGVALWQYSCQKLDMWSSEFADVFDDEVRREHANVQRVGQKFRRSGLTAVRMV